MIVEKRHHPGYTLLNAELAYAVKTQPGPSGFAPTMLIGLKGDNLLDDRMVAEMENLRRRTDRVTCRCGREEALSFAAGTCGRGGRGVESGGAKNSAGQASPSPGFAGSVWVRHASRDDACPPKSAQAVFGQGACEDTVQRSRFGA